MSNIINVHGREILDSRGNPTVEVDITTDNGKMGSAAVPSGASTGSREALELRDGNKNRYMGKGVLKAVQYINEELGPRLVGMDVSDQTAIDNKLLELDGTENKSRYGANSLLGISLANVNVAALEANKPLYQYLANDGAMRMPVPLMNIINGGAHADNSVDLQEFMVIPAGAPTFAEALRYGAEIFHHLRTVLSKRGMNTSVGDEGGFAPDLRSNEEAIEVILEAIHNAGYTAGKEVYLGLDVASSEFYKEGLYDLASENRKLNADEFVDYLSNWVDQYPILSIEDGMDESDWVGWKSLSDKLGNKIQLVGDDLFVTNTKILQRGIDENIANSILIKFNQIGTLTETLAAIKMATKAGYSSVISHRSGETEDTTIADLAVATNAGQIKTGSLSRSDRVAKYNRLLRIEEQLGDSVAYAGLAAFPHLK